jgi:hypothetical protein
LRSPHVQTLEHPAPHHEIFSIGISAIDLDYELMKELEENRYIARYIEKPIHLANLIEIVSHAISQMDQADILLET